MTEEKYYIGKNDLAFKEIFLKESNKDLLKELLEYVLKEKIKEIQIKPNERNQDNVKIRRKYYDALVKTEKGKYDIEVNANQKDYLRPRNMSYLTDLYSHHTLKGKKYDESVDIVQINLSYGMIYNENNEIKRNKDMTPLRVYYVMDKEYKKYVKNFVIYEFNMDYYIKLWYDEKSEEIKENKVLVMQGLERKELEKLSKLDRINEDPEFREYMTHEEDLEKIQNSLLYEAEEKGIEKGINERNIEIAKNMIKKGMKVEDISEITELSKEEIEKLLSK